MARSDGPPLKIGSRVYMTWPDPMQRLLDLNLIEVVVTHAQPITFKLKNKGHRSFSERDIELILQATTARSIPYLDPPPARQPDHAIEDDASDDPGRDFGD